MPIARSTTSFGFVNPHLEVAKVFPLRYTRSIYHRWVHQHILLLQSLFPVPPSLSQEGPSDATCTLLPTARKAAAREHNVQAPGTAYDGGGQAAYPYQPHLPITTAMLLCLQIVIRRPQTQQILPLYLANVRPEQGEEGREKSTALDRQQDDLPGETSSRSKRRSRKLPAAA